MSAVEAYWEARKRLLARLAELEAEAAEIRKALREQGPGPIKASESVPRSDGPTKRQLQYLRVIAEAIAHNGVPPTIKEIGTIFGVSSTNAVVCVLRGLELKGYIDRTSSKSRSIRIMEPGRRLLASLEAEAAE